MMDDTDEVKCEGLLTFVLGICKFPTRKRAILNRLKIIQKKKDNVCCLIIMLYVSMKKVYCTQEESGSLEGNVLPFLFAARLIPF